MPNRLVSCSSPYLQQHRENPINWYPWCEEAFAAAKAQNKPIFLSIGYSSCHWCHVMAHESFEDQEVANILNQHFINIKVDREERPDVDETYMTAVQLATGRGGWPMTLFLTPEKKPFFAGTYFPKDDSPHHPGFISILNAVVDLWNKEEERVRSSAERFTEQLRPALERDLKLGEPAFEPKLIESFFESILGNYEPIYGGFGARPKFPPHCILRLILNYLESGTPDTTLGPKLKKAALHTLEKIALGGIHDIVGGGFHRYSTDEKWLLPHFEKMLYDNALLLENYSLAKKHLEISFREHALLEQAVAGIVRWLQNEMTSPEGLFYSAIDADSEEGEGRYYMWTLKEIQDILGVEAPEFIESFGIKERGNFREEATGEYTSYNILYLKEPPSKDYSHQLVKLYEARQKRTRPSLDHKALASWNGLMIKALTLAHHPELATQCAKVWVDAWKQLGYLPHQITASAPEGRGFLDDYAYLAEALYTLATFLDSPEYRKLAFELTQEMVALFHSEKEACFYYTSDHHENIFGKFKPLFDQAVPSAQAIAIQCLLNQGELPRAQQSLLSVQSWMEQAPELTASFLNVYLRLFRSYPKITSAPLVPHPTWKGWHQTEIQLEVPEGLHFNSEWLPLQERYQEKQPLQIEITGPSSETVEHQADFEQDTPSQIRVNLKVHADANFPFFNIKLRFQLCSSTKCLPEQEYVLKLPSS